LSFSKADECEVSLNGSEGGNIRYARNAVSTAGDMSSMGLAISSTFGKKTGSATINEFDDASLEKVVRRSEELAQLAPANPEYVSLEGPKTFAESITFNPATAAINPDIRAEAVRKSLEVAKAANLEAAGFLENTTSFRAIMNSKGLYAYNKDTDVSFSVTTRNQAGKPGSAPNSGTRLVTLDDLTRRDASRDFGGKENVPTKAITMGIGTIFKAREIILMAWSLKKASIIKKAVEGEISSEVPATYLQLSDNVEFILDQDAASDLTRFNTPWLVKDCIWDDQMVKKAVIWLANTLGKPILKLTEEDYNSHGMAQLATEKGPVYNINIHIFNKLQHTITGWPGGKGNADDSQRPERAVPDKKRVIIFSPHPDDDVISMGGTFIRLVDQGHDVNVAYQTSGNTAVWDDDALRFVEFARDFSKSISLDTQKLDDLYHSMRNFLETKQPNQADTSEIQILKGLIRKGEAISGARFAGLSDEQIHFMSLPFYDRGKTHKNPVSEDDIKVTMDLLEKIKPHQIFAAGDFADPHGTHKVCFDILIQALERLKDKEWIKDCWLWLYRGAWHEFETHEIQMAVPLSPQEVERKRFAIFKHQSQKDRPVFPGDDAREFWVRAEDRTRETAKAYDKLGLAEYEAMEAFVRWKF
jgi:glucosamine-6-phosphate deaminase